MGNGTNAVILIIIIVAAFFLWQGGYLNGIVDKIRNLLPKPTAPNDWQVQTSVSPSETGGKITVNGSPPFNGFVSVNQGNTLVVSAEANEGWTFQNWVFDDLPAGNTPVITLPAQHPNSTHTLVAVFQLIVTAFEITPAKYFTQGLTIPYYTLNLVNNENVEIKNVRLRLNDPYGVFSKATVAYTWKQNPGGGGTQPWSYYNRPNANCLNVFTSVPVMFGVGQSDSHYNILPHSSSIFYLGDNSYYQASTAQNIVSSSIQAGTYHLSWSIQFEIVSGSFSYPPELTIPWDVTIYG